MTNTRFKNWKLVGISMLMMASAFLTSCQGTSSVKVNKEGWPITKEKTTLRIMTIQFPYETEFDTMAFTKDYEEKTNIKIEWELLPSSDLTSVQDKKILALSSGNMPDVFMLGSMMKDDDILKYAPSGKIVALDSYLDYAPNFKKAMEENPWIKQLATSTDGKIYGIPSISEVNTGHSIYYYKMYINQKWLDTLGLTVPKTMDQLLNVLRSFRDNDPNGNGIKDEIPVSMSDFYSAFFISPFGGPCYTYSNSYMAVDANNKVVFGPSTPEYKRGLQFCSELLAEGLLDKNFLSIGSKAYIGQLKQNKVGLIMSYADYVDLGYENDDWTMMSPVQALEGVKPTWSYLADGNYDGRNFVITSACKNIEAAMRWADYFWSSEGEMYGRYGPEGIYWGTNSDGKWVLYGDEKRPAEFEDNSHWLGSLTPGYMLPLFTQKATKDNIVMKPESEMTKEELKNAQFEKDTERCYSPYIPKYNLPKLTFTKEQSDILQLSSSALSQEYSRLLNAVVNGGANVDAEWDGYIAELKKRGLDNYVKAYQDAYDNYSIR